MKFALSALLLAAFLPATALAAEGDVTDAVHYVCDGGVKVDVQYLGAAASLRFGKQAVRLARTASGQRFEDKRWAWAMQGQAGTLQDLKMGHTVARSCRVTASKK